MVERDGAGAGFVSGLIGGNGIRRSKGNLVKATGQLNEIIEASKSGMKFVGSTARKAVKQAAQNFERVYALESLITTGKYFLGSVVGNTGNTVVVQCLCR